MNAHRWCRFSSSRDSPCPPWPNPDPVAAVAGSAPADDRRGGSRTRSHSSEAPDGSARLFVVDQTGPIRIVRAAGPWGSEPFLTSPRASFRCAVVRRTRGAGARLPPGLRETRPFFVLYSAPLRPGAPAGWNSTLRLSEFAVSPDPERADDASERIPARDRQAAAHHNGGTIAFGPDGFLYVSVGDGGRERRRGGARRGLVPVQRRRHAQSPAANLLGKILRIDPDGEQPVRDPPDNPFTAGPERPEIWAFGFRNPYRMAFRSRRRATALRRRCRAGAVGGVDIVVRGGNYAGT